MMCIQQSNIVEIRETTHERVMKAMKMDTIPHFFIKDVGRVCLAGNVLNRNCFVLNPFPNQIFTQLNVASRLRSHVVRPFDASFIVVVDKIRVLEIRDRETGLSDAPTDVSEVDYLFRSGACGANLGLTMELREVRSCRSQSQPRGPPFLNMIPPLMLQNLKSGRRVPSATAFPICEPQQASL
jgi:hypothetical protein